MERVKVKDLVDLMDYDRKGGTALKIKEETGLPSYVSTSSPILDLISDLTVGSIFSDNGYICITLLDEEFEEEMKRRAQE